MPITPKDLDTMKLGRIRKKDLSVAFQIRENPDAKFHRVCFYLPDKHLYSSSYLKYIVDFVSPNKANSVVDKKCFSDMINWYVQVHKSLLGIIQKLFKVQKQQQQ
ncbi:unnamed protein product [Lactuca saligna]|uniref:Uncharacterized protein n=1 Tax=Lactuca saligna TaxID=75948 RepID=A0AA36E803_LACSI|nr:unnamed protein product [Lactuca saligna]